VIPDREEGPAPSALTSELGEAHRSISSSSHQLLRAEESARIQRAFDRLEPEEREPISMKRLLGL